EIVAVFAVTVAIVAAATATAAAFAAAAAAAAHATAAVVVIGDRQHARREHVQHLAARGDCRDARAVDGGRHVDRECAVHRWRDGKRRAVRADHGDGVLVRALAAAAAVAAFGLVQGRLQLTLVDDEHSTWHRDR